MIENKRYMQFEQIAENIKMTTNIKPVAGTDDSDDFGRDDTDEDFARAGMLAYQASKKELGYDSDEFDLERCTNTINEREDEDGINLSRRFEESISPCIQLAQ